MVEKKQDDYELLKSQGLSYTEKGKVLEDVKSSAYSFLLIGILGIAVLILNWFGIIKISMDVYMKTMTTVVMGALFLFFILIGIKSLLKVKTLNHETDTEQQRTQEITAWMLSNYSLEQLDAALDLEGMSMEQAYFIRFEKMAALIQAKFGNMDEKYLDYLIEKIYQTYSPMS